MAVIVRIGPVSRQSARMLRLNRLPTGSSQFTSLQEQPKMTHAEIASQEILIGRK
jgi:hypothetical protein